MQRVPGSSPGWGEERDGSYTVTKALYVNELSRALEHSEAPGLTLLDCEVKSLLFAHDLQLLFPTKEGLQQHLDFLHKFRQTLALTVISVRQK